MPTTGAASYTGRVGADLTGGSDGSVLADVSLTATFSSGDVTGEIYNINVFDDSGAPDQKLKGKVPLSGNVLTNKMTASGSGKLTGVDSGFTGDSTASVILNGQFRTNTAPADTVTGTITGSGTGDFDFVLANGKFYAE